MTTLIISNDPSLKSTSGEFIHSERPKYEWDGNTSMIRNCDLPESIVAALADNVPPPQDTITLTLKARLDDATSLAEAEQELEALDEQILALQQRRAGMIRTITPKWMKMNAYDTVLSPFRHLPTEILQDIALFALPSQPSFVINQVPISVSHVCKHWRSAVLSLPVLWTELYLEVTEVHTHNASVQCREMVKTWFKRAGPSRPLSFHFFLYSISRNASWVKYELAQPLSETIFSRVRHLSLGAPCVVDLFPCFQNSFKSLDTVALKNTNKEEPVVGFEYGPEISKGNWHIACDIRKLILDHGITNSGPCRPPLPWSNLSSLVVLESISVDRLVYILHDALQLKIGEFSIYESSEYMRRNDPHIHSFLQHLILSIGVRRVSLADIFEAFDFPQIKMVDLQGINAEGANQGQVDSEAMNSIKTVEKYFIHGPWIYSIETFEGIMSVAPSIRELILDIPLSPLLLLQRLTLHEEVDELKPCLLPNLAFLSVAILPDIKVDKVETFLQLLEAFIRSRMSHKLPFSQRIQQLHFFFRVPDEALEMKVQDLLRPYEDLGLAFTSSSYALKRDWYDDADANKLRDWGIGMDERRPKNLKKLFRVS